MRPGTIQFLRPLVISSLVMAGFVTMARGQTDETPTTSDWSVDDVIFQESSSGWSISRDGKRALWQKSRADRKKDRRVSTLMLTDLDTLQTRELTVGGSDFSSPTFSRDGQGVLFRSGRKIPEGLPSPPAKQGGPQLWLLDLRGGEPRPLTAVPFGIGAFQWVGDDTVYFVTRERWSLREAEEKKRKDDTIVVEEMRRHREGARRLFRLDLKTKKIVRITSNEDRVQFFRVSPDGRFVVLSHGIDPSHGAEGKAPPRWYLRNLETGDQTELFSDRQSKPMSVAWTRGSEGFYIRYPHSTHDGQDEGAVTFLKYHDVGNGRMREVELEWPRGLAFGGFEITSDGFITSLADGTRVRFARYRRDENEGHQRHFLAGDDIEHTYSLTKARDDARVIVTRGTASEPPSIRVARLSGDRLTLPREIFRPNRGFAGKTLARSELIRWTGAEGDEVEGILYYPHDYRPGERHPLVVMTHGGPHGADRDIFRESYGSCPNLYAQRGAFVLKTNYHGSSSYGLEFGESIRGRYYELEVEDIFSGIQKLIDDGLVDRDRMGLVGWSNGAILSIAALTLDHLYAPGYDFQFQACAPGAGDVNWTSDYGNCAFGGSFDDYYLGGPPWELPELYLKKSPLFHVQRVETPTIIFFGTEDTNVPTGQGWEWYRALHSVGRAPVRFLLFPGEPHGLRKLTHQHRKLSEELAWFDGYLFETATLEPDPIQDGTPIDLALRVPPLRRTGNRVGVHSVSGRLIPETAEVGGFLVGRAEVTVAQWREFDPDLTQVPTPLHDSPDHPVTGLDEEAARAYVEWLRQETDEPWRLLTEKEFRTLKSATGPRENTLDQWAGYRPSLADARTVRERVEGLGLPAALMRAGACPPGVFGKGQDQVTLFDLGGNAAELVEGENRETVVVGGCAILSPDPWARRTPPRDYVGLRVAKDRPVRLMTF